MTKILKCNCIHVYQDSIYGLFMRLFNSCGKSKDKYRCTVCGTVKE